MVLAETGMSWLCLEVGVLRFWGFRRPRHAKIYSGQTQDAARTRFFVVALSRDRGIPRTKARATSIKTSKRKTPATTKVSTPAQKKQIPSDFTRPMESASDVEDVDAVDTGSRLLSTPTVSLEDISTAKSTPKPRKYFHTKKQPHGPFRTMI